MPTTADLVALAVDADARTTYPPATFWAKTLTVDAALSLSLQE